jgi:hypothetical protein
VDGDGWAFEGEGHGQYGDKSVTEVGRYLDAALEAVLRIAVG